MAHAQASVRPRAHRESSNHGAWNSWDRQPYVTTVGDGRTQSATPAYSRLHHNFIVANYAADGGCFDNDDGSSYYREEFNFCVFGGMKSNFEAHNKRSTGNVHAFASAYGEHCLNGVLQPELRYSDGYQNNTCILGTANDLYLQLSQAVGNCSFRRGRRINLLLGGNTVYAPGGEVSVGYGFGIDTPGATSIMPGADWLQLGLDNGTRFLDSKALTTDRIISMGTTLITADL